MPFSYPRLSLSAFFGLLSIVLLLGSIVLSLIFWVAVYQEELEQKNLALATEAARLDMVLTDTFDYTAKYVEFVGEKILHGNTDDLSYIAGFIGGSYIRPQEEKLYVTTTFDWVTPDKQLRVSSKRGILSTPFDMSDRDYLERTATTPWKLQLSPPRYGGLSREWIIPGGMGFTDKHGDFVGSITLGFALDGLSRRLAEAMSESDLRYRVFTQEGALVLDSAVENNAATANPAWGYDVPAQAITAPHYLSKPWTTEGTKFAYARPVGKYPFIILTGYPENMKALLFREIVLSHLSVFSGVALAALILLYFLGKRLVRPVIQLARAADQITYGKPTEIPSSSIREIALLATQLQKVSDYVQNEHRITQELEEKKALLEESTEALKKSKDEAIASAAAAKQAAKAKSEFLTNISHELRTPMNAVIGLTNILLSKKYLPEKQEEYLHVMQNSAEHLMQLINDLLDFSKLESGKTLLEDIAFDLPQLLEDVLGIVRVQARQKPLRMELEIISVPPGMVRGDPHRLQQIVLNLLGNAVKFTDRGKVTLELECNDNPETSQCDVTLRIRDTGIGIPAEKLDSIFDKFTQADSSVARTHGGTGLGLAITKALVERMWGVITVESTYGKGTCFTIRIPFPHEKAATEPQKLLPAPEEESPSSEKGHVLLVEDYQGNIVVATTLLAMHGFTCELAQTGRQALATLQNNHEDFDLVLMDVQMPGMDGLEVTQRVRAHEESAELQRLPIIGMTAHSQASDRQKCLDVGMDDYIAKPFNPDTLITLIQKFIRRNKSGQKAA